MRSYTKKQLYRAKKEIDALRTHKNPQITQISLNCNSSKCSVCPDKIIRANHILNSHSKLIPIDNSIKCDTPNIIYGLQCQKCLKYYIGQTTKDIRTRVVQHNSNIKLKKPSTFAQHINQCGSKFNITILQHLQVNPDPIQNRIQLLKAESQWIKQLATIQPLGINQQYEAPPPIPLIIPYSDNSKTIITGARQLYANLQTQFPHIYRSELIIAYSKNKSIRDYLIKT